MNRRFALTLIWLGSFVLVVVTIEMYYWGYPTERKLIEDERVAAYTPVVAVYGAHLAAILGAWFKKPFPLLPIDPGNDNPRFIIALVSTILFNLLVLYFVSLSHWHTDAALATITSAMKLAGIFSIIVGPVNLYYFGVKGQTTAGS